jgi:glycosyltransferase involved in cell wall biosynthesis
MRIAWFTPLSARSAIGEFSVHVAAELAKHAEVELWTSDEPPYQQTDLKVIGFSSASTDLDLLHHRDMAIYNMGDYLPFHGQIDAVSRRHPGVVILHDRVLHHLYAGMWLMGDTPWAQTYIDRMNAYYGKPGAAAARDALAGRRTPVWESDEEVLRYPLYEEAIAGALGVITHSDAQATDIATRWLGPVRALRLPCYSNVLRDIDAMKRPIRERDTLHLVTVGHLNPNKQVDRFVDMLVAAPQLASKVRYSVVGPDDGFKSYVEGIKRVVERHRGRVNIELLGWRSREDLDRLMAEADVFVNLRHPVMEGGSASLVQQLAYGRPVLCFDAGFFGEVPAEALMRAPAGDFNAVREALQELLENPALRQRVGDRARAVAASYDERHYVEGLLDLIDQSRRAKPMLSFLDSVASELGGLGVSSQMPIYEEIANDFGRVLAL